MLSSGLQPAYKAPTAKTPDDASVLTLLNTLVTRANDMYLIMSALSNTKIDNKQLVMPGVTQKNIKQYITTLNYLHDVYSDKLHALTTKN